MAFNNSFAKWVYLSYIKAPDSPIPRYEPITNDEGRTLFRSLDSSKKTVTEIDAVRQIAKDERIPFSDAWNKRREFFAPNEDDRKPLPEQPRPYFTKEQEPQQQQQQQQQRTLPSSSSSLSTSSETPEHSAEEIRQKFLNGIESKASRLLSAQEKQALNQDFIDRASQAKTPDEMKEITTEHISFYRQGYSDEFIDKNIIPQVRRQIQQGLNEGRIQPLTTGNESEKVTPLDYYKYGLSKDEDVSSSGSGHSGRLRPGMGVVIRSWEPQQQQQQQTRQMELDR